MSDILKDGSHSPSHHIIEMSDIQPESTLDTSQFGENAAPLLLKPHLSAQQVIEIHFYNSCTVHTHLNIIL